MTQATLRKNAWTIAQKRTSRRQTTRQHDLVRLDMLDQDPTCRYCGADVSVDEAAVDHIVPTSQGGDDGRDNLALCCQNCLDRKGGLTAEELLRWAFQVASHDPDFDPDGLWWEC